MAALLRAQKAQAKAPAFQPSEIAQLELLEPHRYQRPEVERAQLADRPRRKRRR